MKLLLEITNDSGDSNGVKEYAVIVRGQFPITKRRMACELQDGLLEAINEYVKPRKRKNV